MNSNKYHIESPCIRHCCLNDNDVCLGCFRSIEEITGWSQANAALRAQFLDNARQRSMAYKQKSNNRPVAKL